MLISISCEVVETCEMSQWKTLRCKQATGFNIMIVIDVLRTTSIYLILKYDIHNFFLQYMHVIIMTWY